MPERNHKALMASMVLYLIVSPLSTYNTLAMFGVVESRLVPVQLSITAVMIFFAIVASRVLGKHCATNETCKPTERRLWTAGFYVIGPPVLYAYYRLRYSDR
jgi:hypothetical protein